MKRLLLACALLFSACSTSPKPESFTLYHVHVVGCTPFGRMTVLSSPDTRLILFKFSGDWEGRQFPQCNVWNQSVFWDIRMHGVDDVYVFEYADMVK